MATDEAERKSLAARFDRLSELLHHQDAYTIDHKVETVLEGLGFRSEDYAAAGGVIQRRAAAPLALG